jgi:hypothetical protein
MSPKRGKSEKSSSGLAGFAIFDGVELDMTLPVSD